jgi:rRNA biogenesis protein RRP5
MDQSEAWERSSVATTIQMEEDYPRGGEELVTPLERRKIRHQAERDDLFGQMMFDDTPIAGESKVKRKEMKQEDIFTIKDKVIDHISPKYMTEGVLILGAVCAVHQYKMIMSLPFNMTGSVNIGDVSDPLAAKGDQFDESLELSQMFHVGQIFPCYVLSVDDKNHVMLSINPRLVNVHLTARTLYPNMLISGCIKSIEDHGYIVDFGIPDKNGFLLKTNASDYIKLHHDGNPLCVGQIITCHIPSIPDGSRSIPVSIPDQSNISFLPSDSSLFTLFSIIPGLPVNGVVKTRTPNGMIVYYLRGFEGVVNIHHLPLKHPLSLEKFTKKKIQGRVLWVDMLNKRSGLTLHTELVQNVGHQFTGMKIGTIFHDAEIILVEPHKGVVLSLPGGGRGFSPLRLMYDTKTDKVTKIHSLGSHHSCRVVQFNYIDGAAIVSLQDSILEESLMTVDDVVTGSLVEGVVSKMIAKGANIRLGKHVFGFCPLDESHSKVTRRKFVEGQTVKCRVMFVDVPNQFVMLSCRRGLISSQLPPLLDIASAVVGQYYDGQIISVADGGIVVQFYNKITGFIPPMELCSSSAQVVLDPKSAFKFGQVITCRVVQIGERRLKLSLRAVGEATPTDTPKVSPGEILDLEVTGIMSGGLSLVYPTTKELIYLPTDALSDYPHHCHELLSFHSSQLSEATSRGSPYMLHGVLMLTRGSSLSPAVGTLKKLLIQAATDGSYPKSFVEEKVGMILPGVVKRIYSYGCFIEFPNGLIGLAPIRLLSDDFISDAAGIYKPMQTVIAKVHDQDEEKERTLLSLRSSDLRLSLYKSSGSLSDILLKHFTNISQEKQLILSNTSGQCYKPGTIINAEVTSISMKYVHLSLDNGLHEGVAYRDPSYVEGLSPGGVVKCCILDWDIIDNHYWVTMNPLIFKETKVEEKKKKNISKKQLRYKSQFKLQIGHTVSAVVEHVTSYYFICTASTLTGSTLAYGLFDTGQWGVIPSQLKHVKPGIRIDGTVISSSSTLLLNNSSSSTSSSDLPVILLGKSVKCNEFVSEQFNVTIGTIIEAKVLGRVANQLNVSYGPWRGRVHFTMITDDPLENSFPANSYSPGDILKAKVIGFINAKAAQARIKSSGPTYLELTTRESLLTDDSLINDKSIQDAIHKDYVVGELVMGVIKKIFKKTMIVSLTPHLLMCVSNSLIPHHSKPIKKHYCSGQVVKCAVIECTRPRNKEVQYHGSMLLKSSLVGHIVEGVVSKILPYERLEVKLDGNVGGFVDVTDVSDHFIGNPLSYFNVGDKYK